MDKRFLELRRRWRGGDTYVAVPFIWLLARTGRSANEIIEELGLNRLAGVMLTFPDIRAALRSAPSWHPVGQIDSRVTAHIEEAHRRAMVDEVENQINDELYGSQMILPQVIDTLQPLLESGELNVYGGYAPGSGEPNVTVFAADWNEESIYDRIAKERIEIGNAMHRLGEILEGLQMVEIDWSDSVSMCGGCSRAIATEPSGFFWLPPYAIVRGDILCLECLQTDPSDFLEDVCERDEVLRPHFGIDPADHGYSLILSQEDREVAIHIPETLFSNVFLETPCILSAGIENLEDHVNVYANSDELSEWLDRSFDAYSEQKGDEKEIEIDLDNAHLYLAYLLEHRDELNSWPENLEYVTNKLLPS